MKKARDVVGRDSLALIIMPSISSVPPPYRGTLSGSASPMAGAIEAASKWSSVSLCSCPARYLAIAQHGRTMCRPHTRMVTTQARIRNTHKDTFKDTHPLEDAPSKTHSQARPQTHTHDTWQAQACCNKRPKVTRQVRTLEPRARRASAHRKSSSWWC